MARKVICYIENTRNAKGLIMTIENPDDLQQAGLPIMYRLCVIASLAAMLLFVGCEKSSDSQSDDTATKLPQHECQGILSRLKDLGIAEEELRGDKRYANSMQQDRLVDSLVKMSPDVIPYLCEALRDENERFRSNAHGALRKIGPPAVETLRKIGHDPLEESSVRVRALWVLGRMKSPGEEVIDDFIGYLGSNDPEFRRIAACALDEIGPVAARAVPHLIPLLKDKNREVRTRAASALGRMGPAAKDAGDDLLAMMEDKSFTVRRNAARALGRIRPPAEKTIPVLTLALKDRNMDVRHYAAEALGRYGPEALPAVKQLIDLFDDKIWRVRGAAVDAIGRIGPEATEAIPALIERLGVEEFVYTRSSIAKALGGFGPKAKDAVPALIKAINDKEICVQGEACRALGLIGPDAREAIPALKRLTKVDHFRARMAALALKSIQKK